MSREFFSREITLIGEEAFEKLSRSRVILFGVGGVGGYILEALVRAGVGSVTVVDNDVVSASNINRQILATSENIGEKKTVAAVRRAKQINPDVNIDAIDLFYLPEVADRIDLSGYNYIIDAIDTVSAKIELAKRAKAQGKKTVGVIFCGRPVALENIEPYLDSILIAWHSGTRSAVAAAKLLFGDYSPEGRAAVTFVRKTGHIPLYYNREYCKIQQ